jgi:hypothetical protein
VDTQDKASPGSAGLKTPKLCVYTALLGGYEELNEQPIARQSSIPFVCFTDDPELRSDTWQVRLVTPVFGMDPARSQRDLKLRPHLHLPEFEASLYVDNSVVLSQPPEKVFEKYDPAKGFWLAQHSFRESVLDEFLTVARLGLDDQVRVFEQLNHYTLQWPELLQERQYWGGILLRNHRDAKVRAMLEFWYANVLRYSRRDQLSVNLAFRQAGLVPEIMDIDNFSSWFHSWPHAPGRDRKRGVLDTSVSFSPPVARVRQLERALAETERRYKEAEESDAWRLGHWLIHSAERHRLLVYPFMRVLRRLSRKRVPR